MERRDPIDRVVDFAFGVPIAGVAFSRELTKIAAHRFVRSAQRAGADLAVRIVDERARAATPPVGLGGDRSRASAESVSTDTDTDVGAESGTIELVDVIVETDDGTDGAWAPDSDTVELAIEGYEHLGARQIVGMLADLTDDELATIETFELDSRGRQTVLSKIEQVRVERAGQ